ncbi:transposase (fragment) [Mesorhizobium plurifarium]|uniref:Transposase n=1 Tax=Mesorhizobium plurifarium TaxID=69974 RepID=A0A0K2VYY8_MESPL
MSVLSRPEFHDEAKAFEHVESILWPDGPVCPKCGSAHRHYSLKGVRTKPSKKNPNGVERYGLYKCSACRSQFTVRMGTIFEESHLPLTKWLQAIHLMCASKKGISAHQMYRILECTYEAAWFLCHRIRLAMASGALAPMGGGGNTVEVDETYIGRLQVAPVNRGGGAHKNSVTARMGNVTPIVRANIAKESALMTDESGIYRRAGQDFASHEFVTHSKDEYIRGNVHAVARVAKAEKLSGEQIKELARRKREGN